jgi:hypothetical protein
MTRFNPARTADDTQLILGTLKWLMNKSNAMPSDTAGSKRSST